MELVIGTKRWSTWSLRPWLALKRTGAPFSETLIGLRQDEGRTEAAILPHSPSGLVPALKDGDLTVWDSLAIIEYANERFPQAGLWPKDMAARAHARAISAEMHSGFVPLRSECGMNIHRPVRARALSDDARANIARIQEIWTECRARHGADGPYLFGAFTAADAMFAPVVHRFRLYDIAVTPPVRAYMDTMQANAAFREWTDAALAETLLIDRFEID